MKNNIVLVVFLLIGLAASSQDSVIQIYKGVAPGSEKWNWEEKSIKVPDGRILSDVSTPTLTAFIPANPNGTAVIIAPGGAFHILSFDNEGTDVAKWLNSKGIAAFVLKYRVVHEDPAHPENSLRNLFATSNFRKLDSINAPVVLLALKDGLTAMEYVRSHAKAYQIDPQKIGFMGFSAGGTLTMSVVYSATDDDRPNFVAPIYAYANAIIGSKIPKANTPIFVAATSDDDLVPVEHSLRIYSAWTNAKQPTELHLYEKGGHGFGMKKQNLPVDSWREHFANWLQMHGFLPK